MSRKNPAARASAMLEYATPAPNSRSFRCLWVALPFTIGCLSGAFLIGLIVCLMLDRVLVVVVEWPRSSAEAFVVWMALATFACFPLLFITLLELTTLVLLRAHPLQRRRARPAVAIGIAAVCIPIALGLLSSEAIMDQGWVFASLSLSLLVAPLLLVREADPS